MLITRTSQYSGIERTMDLPVTNEQFNDYNKGMLVTHAFPQLTKDQREFLITGMTADEWDELFKDHEQ
jgi:hypothetical protein